MWLLLWAVVHAEAGVTWAEHVVHTQGTHRVVSSRFELDRVEPIPLAHPLPASAEVRSGSALRRDEAGQVIALLPQAREAELEWAQPVDAPLAVPIADSSLPQRVVLRDQLFEPDPSLGLESRVGGWVEPGIRPKERMRLRRKRARGQTIWVTGTGVAREGLAGTLRPRGPVAAPVVGSVLTLFALVLAGLYVGYRWLEHLARRERLERYMADEFVQSEIFGRPMASDE